MCGASSQQKDIEKSQAAFYNEMTSEYKSVFGQAQGILSTLTKSFQPILDKGINQQGYSPDELANLNSQAVTGTGVNYAKAKEALANQQAAEGGGNTFVPTGAKEQQNLELASSAAQNESAIEGKIASDNYSTGRENYLSAANALGGVASQLNPAGLANATTGAGGAAASTADAITQANNSWMQLAGAGLGAAGTAIAGHH